MTITIRRSQNYIHYFNLLQISSIPPIFPFAHSTPSSCRLFIGDDKSTGTRPGREITLPAVNQYTLQGERFSRLVRGEQETSFPLETALASMHVIDALFRSERSGGWEPVRP
ncbi:MAG: hypothetical protein COA89_16485 [Acidithiobacillus sp.]|nr:MAG: hypothetical protein COA89_16485 [Acidithiobacillus sp.]